MITVLQTVAAHNIVTATDEVGEADIRVNARVDDRDSLPATDSELVELVNTEHIVGGDGVQLRVLQKNRLNALVLLFHRESWGWCRVWRGDVLGGIVAWFRHSDSDGRYEPTQANKTRHSGDTEGTDNV